MTNKDPLALSNQLCFSLYSANRAMNAMYRPLLAPFKITYPQYLVFLVMWEAMDELLLPIKVTDIGEKLYLDTGTLTPLLKRMEKSGWITRQRLETDERVVAIDLTEQGRDLKRDAQKIPEQLLCQSMFNVDEVMRIKEVVDSLNKVLRTHQ